MAVSSIGTRPCAITGKAVVAVITAHASFLIEGIIIVLGQNSGCFLGWPSLAGVDQRLENFLGRSLFLLVIFLFVCFLGPRQSPAESLTQTAHNIACLATVGDRVVTGFTIIYLGFVIQFRF
ncbi:MAG: hypothetical protein R3175_08830 [Marinobacter sp.]|uniref:hypothetical protein n=1 Tax=Marinobacter sp. TaxID=50741 RepID=UPI00299EB89F|nr:hypothetical protein [Marinobacter sp.]MDX1756148.1 hypothetical protein [Marinobacter sp.]